MKKVELTMDFRNDKIKRKAMVTASGLPGVESVSVVMKDRKMVLTGNVDPVKAVSELRKKCHTEIVSVEPAKEEEKEKEKVEPLKLYGAYPLYYQMTPPQYGHNYYVSRVEENPNGCTIC